MNSLLFYCTLLKNLLSLILHPASYAYRNPGTSGPSPVFVHELFPVIAACPYSPARIEPGSFVRPDFDIEPACRYIISEDVLSCCSSYLPLYSIQPLHLLPL